MKRTKRHYPYGHKYKVKCIDCHFRRTRKSNHVCTKLSRHTFFTTLNSSCVEWKRRIINDLEQLGESKVEKKKNLGGLAGVNVLLFIVLIAVIVFTRVNSTSLYDCQHDNIATLISEDDSIRIGYTPQQDSQVVCLDTIYTFSTLDTLTFKYMKRMLDSENYKIHRPLDQIVIDRCLGRYNVRLKAVRR